MSTWWPCDLSEGSVCTHPACATSGALRAQRDEATALLRTLEYGSRHLSADGVLVPCCPDVLGWPPYATAEQAMAAVDEQLDATHRATGEG